MSAAQLNCACCGALVWECFCSIAIPGDGTCEHKRKQYEHGLSEIAKKACDLGPPDLSATFRQRQ